MAKLTYAGDTLLDDNGHPFVRADGDGNASDADMKDLAERYNAHEALVTALRDLEGENIAFDPACDSAEDFAQRTYDIIYAALNAAKGGE